MSSSYSPISVSTPLPVPKSTSTKKRQTYWRFLAERTCPTSLKSPRLVFSSCEVRLIDERARKNAKIGDFGGKDRIRTCGCFHLWFSRPVPSTTRPPFHLQLYHKKAKYVIISLWQEKSNCDQFQNRIAIITTNIAISASIRASKTVAKITPPKRGYFILHLYKHRQDRQSLIIISLISLHFPLQPAHKTMAHIAVLLTSPLVLHLPKPVVLSSNPKLP